MLIWFAARGMAPSSEFVPNFLLLDWERNQPRKKYPDCILYPSTLCKVSWGS